MVTKISIFRAKKPIKTVTKKPVRYTMVSELVKLDRASASRRPAPSIAGMEIRKENLSAVLTGRPNNKVAAIVDPEREIPGVIAIAWATPIKKACDIVGS